MIRRTLCMLLALLMLSTGAPISVATAQPDDPPVEQPADPAAEFARLTKEARAAFGQKDYAAAAAAFEAAYEIKPEADILYNLGRAYESAQDKKKAEAYYLRYSKEAEAKDVAKKDALDRVAGMRFASKDWDGALESFEAAYAVTPTANTMYNIGRTQERRQKVEEALAAYEAVYKDPDLPPKAREDAISRIKVLRETMALDKKPDEVKPPVVAPPPPPPDYTAAIVLLSVGGASVLGGVVFAGLTASEHTAFEDATTVEDRRDAADTGELYGGLADGLMIGGGVVAGVGLGILIYQLTSSPSADSRAVTFVPQLGPDEVGAGMMLRF